jgi:putative cofactor-binding repeat protein
VKPCTPGMLALLNTGRGSDANLIITDLYTFVLLDGTTFRINTSGQNISVTFPSFPGDVRTGTFTFSADVTAYPMPDKDNHTFKWGLGVEADSVTIRLAAIAGNVIDGLPVLAAFVAGNMDGALVQVERIYSAPGSPGPNTSNGTIPIMQGNISDINEASREVAEFEVKDRRELLNIPMPFNVYMPGCRWVLYSAGCTLNKASFGVAGTVAAGSGTQQLNVTGPTNPSTYFALGTLKFTSGVNSGQEVEVRTFTSGSPNVVLLYKALANAPAAGDSCTLYPGCDKTQSTCLNKFSNLINFGGQPFVPCPETSV